MATIAPIPVELQETDSPTKCDTNEQKKISKKLKKKYGSDNWYDWSIANWGTKWDVEAHLSINEPKSLGYSFESAWSPPVEWLEKASKMFPKLSFTLEYDEPGVGFKGEATAFNGEVMDDYQEYTDEDYEEEEN